MSADNAATAAETKLCPDCAERVQNAARKCRYCGFRWDGADDASMHGSSTAQPGLVGGPGCDYCYQVGFINGGTPCSRCKHLPGGSARPKPYMAPATPPPTSRPQAPVPAGSYRRLAWLAGTCTHCMKSVSRAATRCPHCHLPPFNG